MLTRLGKYNKLHILPHKSSFYFFYINRQLIIHNKSKFSTRCHLFRMLYEETDSRVSVALLLSTDSTGVPTSAAITSFISKQYKKNTSWNFIVVFLPFNLAVNINRSLTWKRSIRSILSKTGGKSKIRIPSLPLQLSENHWFKRAIAFIGTQLDWDEVKTWLFC